MPKKNNKKRKSSNDSSKENYSQNDNDSDYSNKEKESNKSDEEEISKTKEKTEKSEKSEQSLTEDQKKLLAARKQLHNMALAYDAQKEGEPFSSFLEKKRKAEDGIDQLAIDAKLDSDSIKSLTAFLEDNSFSKLNSDSDGGDEDYSPEKGEPKPKRSENKKKNTKTKKTEKNEEKKNTKSNKKNKNTKSKNKKSETNNKKAKSKNNDKVLEGKFVTFTGSMMVSKEGLKQILVNLGAKITSNVSSNTNILIHGDYLEDGRSYDKGKKYKLAKNKKIDIYSDREFEQYMEELTGEKWRMKDEVEKLGF